MKPIIGKYFVNAVEIESTYTIPEKTVQFDLVRLDGKAPARIQLKCDAWEIETIPKVLIIHMEEGEL